MFSRGTAPPARRTRAAPAPLHARGEPRARLGCAGGSARHRVAPATRCLPHVLHSRPRRALIAAAGRTGDPRCAARTPQAWACSAWAGPSSSDASAPPRVPSRPLQPPPLRTPPPPLCPTPAHAPLFHHPHHSTSLQLLLPPSPAPSPRVSTSVHACLPACLPLVRHYYEAESRHSSCKEGEQAPGAAQAAVCPVHSCSAASR